MSKVNYFSRQYVEGDEDQIIELLRLVFNGWPRFDLNCTVEEHWTWKMKETPLMVNHVVVTETNGKIIGVQQGIAKKMKVGNKVILGNKSGELGVHPEYRRMGVRNSMLQFKKYKEQFGVTFNISLTSNPILVNARARKLKRDNRWGLVFPHPVKYLVRIQDFDKFLKRIKREYTWQRTLIYKLGFFFLKTLNGIQRKLSSGVSNSSDFSIKKIMIFDDKIDDFWKSIKDDYNFIVEKSKDYLNWRFCDKRAGTYDVWQATENDAIIGYMVLRVNKLMVNNPVGFIMEVLALNNRLDVVDSFLDLAKNYFDEKNVNTVHAVMVSGHPYERILNLHGFIDSREKAIVTYSAYKEFDALKQFKNSSPERLHYQYGEFDSI
jgi:hypothetical protein